MNSPRRPVRSVDGFVVPQVKPRNSQRSITYQKRPPSSSSVRRTKTARAAHNAPQPAQQPPQATKPVTASPQQKEPGFFRSFARKLLLLVGMFALIALGFLMRSVVIGQIVIAVYAISALVFKVESRASFLLAVTAFGVVLLATIRTDIALAQTFGVYAFLLLVVGTLSLTREVAQ